MSRDYVCLTINGRLHRLKGAQALQQLSDTLRYDLALTGTKIVCAEGDCGACSVMFARMGTGDAKYQSLNSCICASFLMDGCHIVTVEGLQDGDRLSEVQESMMRNFGGQCGFCTPGFVVSITNMYEQKQQESEKNIVEKDITEQNVKNYLTGNLCRCTGYRPIIDAALAVDVKKQIPLCQRYRLPELSQVLREETTQPIKITVGDREFFAPATLAQAADYKSANPGARLFSGATDIGVQINKGKNPGQKLMSLHLIKELYDITCSDQQIRLGARVTLNELQKIVTNKIPAFDRFLNIFASPQIKNTATVIGNIANGSPIADTTPFFLTVDAQLELLSKSGARQVPLKDFFTGYKVFDLHADEIITHLSFKIPPQSSAKTGIYKISQRRDLDISCVNASFVFEIENGKVQNAQISYGGVGPIPLRLSTVEKELAGKTLTPDLCQKTTDLIGQAITPISDVRGSKEFRVRMAKNLFKKFASEHLGL